MVVRGEIVGQKVQTFVSRCSYTRSYFDTRGSNLLIDARNLKKYVLMSLMIVEI